MEDIKKTLHAGFRTKVLAPMISVLVVMLAVTVWYVDHCIKQQTEESAQSALNTYDKVFRNLEIKNQTGLRLRFQSLANESQYRAVFELQDFNTTMNSLRLMLEDEGLFNEDIGFVLFTPDGGPSQTNAKPMIQQRDASIPSEAFVSVCRPDIERLMATGGEPQEDFTDTAQVANRLFNLISIPVLNREHLPIGVLTFGEEMGGKVVQEYGTFINNPIVLIAGGRVVSSSLASSTNNSQFAELFHTLATATDANSVQRTVIGKDHFFCTSRSFNLLMPDSTVGYLLFSSYDPSANVLRTEQTLLVGCLFAILIGSIVVWYFVNRATSPLRELGRSAEAVGRGDFTRRVPVRTKDEFGELAGVFNQMTKNLEQSRSDLQQTVETLKNTQQQLIQSEKLSAVGEFVAGVAHELNNPLAAVMGFSEILKNTDGDQQNRRHLDMIYKSAQRCQKIVQSLLSFARRQTPERKPVSVNKLIDDVLEIVAYQLRTSNIEVIPQLDSHPPVVLADAHQLQQVLINIINNARQAIEARQPEGWIKITTTATGSTLRISIQDNGPGISEANLKKIFDPFFTTKEVGKGTGLGLSLCYGIIHEHGGLIKATSRLGEGTIFTIELPAMPMTGDTTDLIKPQENTSARSNEGNGKRILVIDDEEAVLQMLHDELTRHGYKVTTICDGETALKLLHEDHFDLVFCDWKMPGLNGRQVYERLRIEQPALCRRVIFITGDVINEQMRAFLETEKCACLAKPFSLAELRQLLQIALTMT